MALPPFEHTVAMHGPVVLRVCRALLGPHDAEDAWSDTFLAALAAYPSLAEGSNIRGWLVTIAHHKAIDRLRAGSRAPVPTEAISERAAPAESDAVEPDTALWAAVRALPPKQRGAVAYHHLADLPYAEVATLLGTSAAAARRSASDGIATLRLTYSREDLR